MAASASQYDSVFGAGPALGRSAQPSAQPATSASDDPFSMFEAAPPAATAAQRPASGGSGSKPYAEDVGFDGFSGSVAAPRTSAPRPAAPRGEGDDVVGFSGFSDFDLGAFHRSVGAKSLSFSLSTACKP